MSSLTKQLSAIIFTLLSLTLSAQAFTAGETICAEVSIEIVQELTIERQGFEATLEIENVLPDKSLDNVSVDVLFHDDNGNAIKASSDPNSADAEFFIRILSQQGVNIKNKNNSIAAGEKAKISWLIVPAPGTAKNNEVGTLYWVSANFNYALDGIENSVPVVPDSIFVKAMPTLTLDYFLPKHVFADNPFTPEVEPKDPFPLCVLIKNNGKGIAKNVKIESAQPEIVDNKQGLLIEFEIIGASLGNQPIQPSLLVNFGDIAPNKAKTACWIMQTSLSGRFKNFTASFSHDAELGGQLTSLIDSVNTHTLLHRVLVQLPGHDSISDLLADDAGAIRVYDTSGSVNDVNVTHTTASRITPDKFKLSIVPNKGLQLTRIPSPEGTTTVPSVIRSDGKHIAAENIWLSKSQRGNEQAFDYLLNIFDSNVNGHYFIDYDAPKRNQPPVFPIIPLTIGFTHEPLALYVRVTDPDNDPLSFTWSEPPHGMSLTTEGSNTLKVSWVPSATQQGRHQINITINDGIHHVSQPLFFTIRSNTDRDGDGLPDDWEQEHFKDFSQAGTDDFDGDGLSNLDELLSERNPAVPDGPASPIIITPTHGYVTSLSPELIINNSTYKGPYDVVYEYEIYEGKDNTSPLYAYYAVPQGDSGVTSWTPPAELLEDQQYSWRVRANNQFVKSLWAYGKFTVNAVNARPTEPVLLHPANSSTLDQAQSHFKVRKAIDPDGDKLAYRFEIYSDQSIENLVLSSNWLPSDPTQQATISWRPEFLFTPGVTYFWQVVVSDPTGKENTSELWSFTPSEDQITIVSPTIISPQVGERVSTTSPSLKFASASEVNHKRTHYIIQVDRDPEFTSTERLEFEVKSSKQELTVPLLDLHENTDYYWRVKAVDISEIASEWTTSYFFVNAENTAPDTPVIKNPGQDAWVASLMPQLAVQPVSDIDRDTVHYEFEIYQEQSTESVTWHNVSDTPDTIVSTPLKDNQWYFWQVRAIDENNEASAWSQSQRFFTDQNGVDDKPSFSWLNPPDALIMNYPRNIILKWTDEDPDSNAVISLFYIQDGDDEKHHITTIQEDKDGAFDQWVWNTRTLEKGIYRIYAQISDKTTTIEHEAPFILVFSDQYIQPGKVKFTTDSYVRLAENGPIYSSGFVLTKQPYTNVTVHIENKSKGVTLLNDTLVFTPDDWSQPKQVTYKVEDNCSYLWYQPVNFVPVVVEYRDPLYPPMKHNALLGHVINDEPEVSFSPFTDICSFKLVQIEPDDNSYIHHYEVSIKSKHRSDLSDLTLFMSSRNPGEISVLTENIDIPSLNAREIVQLPTLIKVRSQSVEGIPASKFNWTLGKRGEQPQW